MKVVMSRKGFDSSNGGCSSPILPDGTLLSLPIPSGDELLFSDIAYKNTAIDQMLKQLNPKQSYKGCHLDPDLRPNMRFERQKGWSAAFGQIGSAQGELRNNNIGKDDLFLFFGRFREVEKEKDGTYYYITGTPDLHIVFGYLQVDRVITDPEEISEYHWHPHADLSRKGKANNALYIPRKKLSFDESKSGYGVLNFAQDRVLTLSGRSMSIWREIPALMPDNIVSNRKNSAKGGGLYYQGIWQELILKENDKSEKWAKSLL